MNNYIYRLKNILTHLQKMLMVAVFLIGISLPILAEPDEHNNNIEFDYQKTAELLSEYLDVEFKIEDVLERCDCKVKVFNENNELVRFGPANNEMMVNLISKSDFLIMLNDIKYYRLNK